MQTIVEIPKTEEQIRSVWSMTKPTEEEKWEHISKLSEIRSKYSCFEDEEEPYYRALSEGIKALKAIPSAEPKTVPIAVIRFDDDKLHEIVEEAVKNIGIEPKRIPCSERLPTEEEYIANNGLFIVSDGNRTYAEYFDVYCSMRFGEPTMSGFRVDRCVTAWMPLPKPYEPTCDTCEYTTAAFNPCNACKDKSEYKPQESEE